MRNVKEQEKGWNCVRLPATKKKQQNQKATKLILSKGYGLTWQKCVLSTTHIPVWTRNLGFASDSHRKGILMTGFIFCVPLIISGPSVFFLSSVQSRDFAMDSNFFRIHLQRNEGLPYCLPLHIHTFLSHISLLSSLPFIFHRIEPSLQQHSKHSKHSKQIFGSLSFTSEFPDLISRAASGYPSTTPYHFFSSEQMGFWL